MGLDLVRLVDPYHTAVFVAWYYAKLMVFTLVGAPPSATRHPTPKTRRRSSGAWPEDGDEPRLRRRFIRFWI